MAIREERSAAIGTVTFYLEAVGGAAGVAVRRRSVVLGAPVFGGGRGRDSGIEGARPSTFSVLPGSTATHSSATSTTSSTVTRKRF